MKRSFYTSTRKALELELEDAKNAVAVFFVEWGNTGETIPDDVGNRWNDAHDRVTRLEFAIPNLDSDYRRSKLDPAWLALVDANID